MTRKDRTPDVTRRGFLKKAAAGGLGATTAVGLGVPAAGAAAPKWHRVADVVVVGSGASGLPAAIRARDLGASVIIVEANSDIGGHAMLSGGSVALGGGTSNQKKYGIEDTADQIYLEITRPEHPMTRYSDRKIARAWADINLEAFDFLIANGVQFREGKPDAYPAEGVNRLRRQWVKVWSDDLNETINGSGGSGLARALEKSARAKGVEILLQHKMTRIIREAPMSGPVLGITVENLKDKKTVHIRARKGIIACTGGSSSNVFVRTIYDPRLTEEYCAGGEPYSLQSGDAEQLGMAIGASLGGTNNAATEHYVSIEKPNWIGCRDGYLRWNPKSPRFPQAGASGISVKDYQNAICVNVLGQRFYNEMVAGNRSAEFGTHVIYDYAAAASASAVHDGPQGKERIGGPIWAIFDAAGATRENLALAPPFVDIAGGYFFSADTLAELARSLTRNKYQKVPMPPANLEQTVARYNSFVDAGKDADFDKPAPRYKIQTPPFYAAWAMPVLHDCYAGLRINENAQVLDVFGKVIQGFYCAGESAAGLSYHGLGRCIGMGYIAGTHAVAGMSRGRQT